MFPYNNTLSRPVFTTYRRFSTTYRESGGKCEKACYNADRTHGGGRLKITLEHIPDQELEVVLRGDTESKEARQVLATLNHAPSFGKLVLQHDRVIVFAPDALRKAGPAERRRKLPRRPGGHPLLRGLAGQDVRRHRHRPVRVKRKALRTRSRSEQQGVHPDQQKHRRQYQLCPVHRRRIQRQLHRPAEGRQRVPQQKLRQKRKAPREGCFFIQLWPVIPP